MASANGNGVHTQATEAPALPILPTAPDPATLAPIAPRPTAAAPEAGSIDPGLGGWVAGMLQSRDIAKLAEALAKAQEELTNPEKNQTATVESRREGARAYSFDYADLAATLNAVRPVLAKHGIALVQTTRFTAQAALILHTRLIHGGSGQWLATEMPVWFGLQNSEPKQYSGALTYARRYSIWCLVGVFGEVDMDAPETNNGRPAGNRLAKVAPRGAESVQEKDVKRLATALISEIKDHRSADALARWAHDNAGDVNRLPEAERVKVRDAYNTRRSALIAPQRETETFDGGEMTDDAGGFDD